MIRGKVVDRESKFPLFGVNVVVTTHKLNGLAVGVSTDENGNFRFVDVPLGRHSITISYLGYKERIIDNVVLGSGREVVLNIDLEESISKLEEITVSASRNGEVSNEMATVSAREFSIEEADRYAGSRGEPARMASNFAGVQGADDSRNDIIIRGNSPQGVLWRIEGINIPNPNHFAIAGTSGGPVSIISNKILSNSDFYTGAFPAEFGNTIAGVFDLKMRNGNNEKFQFTGQFGFLGTEAMLEGPINKEKNSSFLVTYRYANLGLFSKVGIDIGTQAVPQYQDATVRLNFPLKNNANLNFFAIGGNSSVDILISEQDAAVRNIFGSNDRDQYFSTQVGIVGASYGKTLNKKTFIKNTIAFNYNSQDALHEYIFYKYNSDGSQVIENSRYAFDSLSPILDYTFNESKISNHFTTNTKLNSKASIKAGIILDQYIFNHLDSARTVFVDTNQVGGFSPWRVRWDSEMTTASLLQAYVQLKYKLSEKAVFNAGINSQYFGLNKNSFSPIEPRLGFSYELKRQQKINIGLGLHSQLQPTYTYFYGASTRGSNPTEQNLGMGFSKSFHAVLGYDKLLGPNLRLKAETYYQYLFNIPVENRISSFSMVNTGSGFSRFFPDSLVNEGTAKNYGVELTLEKFFSRNYYFMITSSLFEAKYKGSDGIERNTEFNGNYAVNALVAKEFVFKNNNSFNLGGKITSIGGRRYGYVDTLASALAQEIIYLDEGRNSLQFKDYFRLDVKLDYKINTAKATHTIAVDLVNLLGIKNLLSLSYAPQPDGSFIKEEYQLGFLPVFFYRIEL